MNVNSSLINPVELLLRATRHDSSGTGTGSAQTQRTLPTRRRHSSGKSYRKMSHPLMMFLGIGLILFVSVQYYFIQKVLGISIIHSTTTVEAPTKEFSGQESLSSAITEDLRQSLYLRQNTAEESATKHLTTTTTSWLVSWADSSWASSFGTEKSPSATTTSMNEDNNEADNNDQAVQASLDETKVVTEKRRLRQIVGKSKVEHDSDYWEAFYGES